MSNHGNDVEATLRELYKRQEFEKELGATGKFPEGKLNANDKGELKMAIGIEGGKVVLNFGKPTAWIGLTPDLAITLGKMLIEKANQI